jgi:maleylpyruvate isomerase
MPVVPGRFGYGPAVEPVRRTRVPVVPPVMDATSADAILADVGERTLGLVLWAGLLTDDDVLAPSVLPGWTCGHVLAHLADNADALTRALLRGMEADNAGLMYESQAARDASIEAGADRPAAAHRQALLDSAHRLAVAWRALPVDRLGVTISGTAGWTRPLADVPWMRWRELALHAADLGRHAGFAAGDPLAARLLDEVAASWAGRADAPPFTAIDVERDRSWRVGDGVRIEGSTGDLALWLTGRGDGSALSASGVLPALPPWL